MPRELTGRHVLAITVSFFAVIIAVNLYMASKAIGTFPGVEGKNTYYASQNFEANRQAQLALGWTLKDSYADGRLTLDFRDQASGQPADLADLQVLIGRATQTTQDQTPVFIRENGLWVAPVTLAAGKWVLRVDALAANGTRFRQHLQLYVRG